MKTKKKEPDVPVDPVVAAKTELATLYAEIAPAMREYQQKAIRAAELSEIVWRDAINRAFPGRALMATAKLALEISVQHNPADADKIFEAVIPGLDGKLKEVGVRYVLFDPVARKFQLFI